MSNASAPADRTQGERARMTQTARMTSGPQRLRALERANEVRLARAALKRRIAQGQVSAATVILDSPWEAQSWSVGDMLISQRRWGSQRCRKFLSRFQLSERKEIGTLTQRQRLALAAELQSRCTDELQSHCTDELEFEVSSEELEFAPSSRVRELVTA
jgi:hypothetical protein